jgi:primosomal protein N''
MKDYRTHLETLRQQAAEAALISALTTVQHKRELFAKHAQHLDALADEVERAMAAAEEATSTSLTRVCLKHLNPTDPSPG